MQSLHSLGRAMQSLHSLHTESAVRVTTVVHGHNSDLIASAAQLYIKPGDVVLDVTYGKGNFWKKYRPENLITHDLALDRVRLPATT